MSLNDYYIRDAVSYMPYYPESVSEVISYYRRNYPLYLKTLWWRDLNDLLIDSNPDAKCWISGQTHRLLLHHIQYTHLFAEKLWRDVYVLNYDIHTAVHFYKFLKFWTKRTLMTRTNLLRRMYILKSNYCVQQGRIWASVWYIFLSLVSFI